MLKCSFTLRSASPIAVALVLIGLSSCGGGGGGPPSTPTPAPDPGSGGMIQPPGSSIGAFAIGNLGSYCGSGWVAGLATGYSSQSSARTAAINQCRSAGGSNCETGGTFGSGSATLCSALTWGETSRSCRPNTETAPTLAEAETAARAKCRNDGFSNCQVVRSECASSGPASAVNFAFGNTGGGNQGGGNTGGGNQGGGNTGGGNQGGGNSPPVAGGFQDGSVQQGSTLRYDNISRQFSDPDNDRLRITASSNARSFATASVSGDSLIITGVQAFTTGSVTITVTATDPGGLTARATFAVRVTAAPRQWGYYAIYPSNCTGNGRYGFSWNRAYADEASASNAIRSACNTNGGCPNADTFRNLCVGIAVGDRCSYAVRSANNATSAANAALVACRNAGLTNCQSRSLCAGNTGGGNQGGGNTGGGNQGGGNTGGGNQGGGNTGGGNQGGGNTGGGNQGGGNSPPVAGGFQDGSVQQGSTLRYDNISRQFSDPDNDRLRITASSNARSFATASVSGDSLIITGVQAFTTGSVTITVTATDPGGLTARATFAVRVTAAPRQWGYYAIYPSNCTGNGRYGFSWNRAYADEASASNAIRSACNTNGGCPNADTFRNLCVGIAVGDRCSYAVRSANNATSAANAALVACRNAELTNCQSRSLCAGNP